MNIIPKSALDMRICKYFEKSDTGKCKNYQGNKNESCINNCSKIKAKGTIPVNNLEILVEGEK